MAVLDNDLESPRTGAFVDELLSESFTVFGVGQLILVLSEIPLSFVCTSGTFGLSVREGLILISLTTFSSGSGGGDGISSGDDKGSCKGS